MDRFHIALVISSLGGGGAERVLSELANDWASAGRTVTLITLGPTGHDRYPLHHTVRRIGLGLTAASADARDALRHNWERICHLRATLKAAAPDLILSFMDTTNVLTLLASTGLGIPVVVSERIDPRCQPIGTAWDGLRRLLYRRAAALVVQSGSVRDWARRLMPDSAIRVIPNPVRVSKARSGCNPSAATHPPQIVAMGRLTYQKGFDVLLRAFAECVATYPEWRLTVLGEGEERASLERLTATLRLTSRVDFPGHVTDPHRYLAEAGLFVLPSRYEGFPNALLEAMALGLPVVAADCPSGPREIVRPGVDGLLVPPDDVPALHRALTSLMADTAARQRLGGRAREVSGRFSADSIAALWDQLFLDLQQRTCA